MSMTVAIPSNLEEFVQQEVAAGAAGSEQELVTRALEVYRELRGRHTALKTQIGASLAEAELGDTAALDIDAIIASGTERLASDGITD